MKEKYRRLPRKRAFKTKLKRSVILYFNLKNFQSYLIFLHRNLSVVFPYHTRIIVLMKGRSFNNHFSKRFRMHFKYELI